MAAFIITLILVIVILCFKGWQRRSWYTPVIYLNRRNRRKLKQGKTSLSIKEKS